MRIWGIIETILTPFSKGLNYFLSLHAKDKFLTVWNTLLHSGEKPLVAKGKKPTIPKPKIFFKA
jgi:hypothetical protein